MGVTEQEVPAAEQAVSTEEYGRLLRLATLASVTTSVVLIAVKLWGWLISGSVALLASLVDSLMDGVASTVNLVAVRYSLTPADKEHRFGHGKAQALAGLGQATFIAGSAVFLLLHAVERMLNPKPLSNVATGIGVMMFATLATVLLLMLQRYVIKRTDSTAIRADSLHYVSDLLTNLAILLALYLADSGWAGTDPIFAFGVGLFILWSAFGIGRQALNELMDRELPHDIRERVRAIACKDKRVHGIHDLRTRRSGHNLFIQLHLELDDDMSLLEAHAIADRVEQEIQRAYPQAEVLIHEDPVSQSGLGYGGAS